MKLHDFDEWLPKKLCFKAFELKWSIFVVFMRSHLNINWFLSIFYGFCIFFTKILEHPLKIINLIMRFCLKESSCFEPSRENSRLDIENNENLHEFYFNEMMILRMNLWINSKFIFYVCKCVINHRSSSTTSRREREKTERKIESWIKQFPANQLIKIQKKIIFSPRNREYENEIVFYHVLSVVAII